MDETASTLFDQRMREGVAGIQHAWFRLSGDPAPGDMPTGEETRELLGLFARLQSEELRQAVLGVMRAIVDTGRPAR